MTTGTKNDIYNIVHFGDNINVSEFILVFEVNMYLFTFIDINILDLKEGCF